MDGLQQNSDTNLAMPTEEPASFSGASREKPPWRTLPGLLATYTLLTLSAHLLEDVFEVSGLMPSDGRADPSIAAIAFVTIVTFAWTVFVNSLGLTLVVRRFFRISGLSIFRTVELIVIETIRAMAATILRLPLLLVPGLFEWIRLTPISFIVLFDADYHQGKVDAIQAARTYFKRYHLRVLLLLFLSLGLFAVEFAITSSSDHPEPLWVEPWPQLGLILLFAGLRLVCDMVTLRMYSQTFRRGAISADDLEKEKKSNIL